MNAKAAKNANNEKITERINIAMRNKIDKITKTAKLQRMKRWQKMQKGQRMQ